MPCKRSRLAVVGYCLVVTLSDVDSYRYIFYDILCFHLNVVFAVGSFAMFSIGLINWGLDSRGLRALDRTQHLLASWNNDLDDLITIQNSQSRSFTHRRHYTSDLDHRGSSYFTEIRVHTCNAEI